MTCETHWHTFSMYQKNKMNQKDMSPPMSVNRRDEEFKQTRHGSVYHCKDHGPFLKGFLVFGKIEFTGEWECLTWKISPEINSGFFTAISDSGSHSPAYWIILSFFSSYFYFYFFLAFLFVCLFV